MSRAEVTLDGSLGPLANLGPGPTYAISDAVGRRAGNNLFHSFAKFNLTMDETATFTGPAGIINIVSRVTGGRSSIDGTIASTIDGANIYFFNPAGIAFGPHASLNLTGSFHGSTADYLRMADGAKFYADIAKGSTLTSADPVAFGFLASNPAPITVDGSFLQVAEGKTLSMVGGDVSISQGALLASNGAIQIASAAGPGEVTVATTGGLHLDGFSRLGTITLSNAFTDVSDITGAGAGTIQIRGGRLVVDGSFLIAATGGDVNGALTGIDIDVTNDVVIRNGSHVTTTTQGGLGRDGGGLGRAGDVQIKAQSLLLSDSDIFTSSVAPAVGRGGDVGITVGSLTLAPGGRISTGSQGDGQAGQIAITAGSVSLFENSSSITSSSQSSVEPAGPISIRAESLLLDNGASIAAETVGGGRGGDILLDIGSLTLTDGSRITTSSLPFFAGQAGTAGNISVFAVGAIAISGRNSGLFSNTTGSGQGGDVAVSAWKVRLADDAAIAATSSGSGNAGAIRITASDLFESFHGSVTGEATHATGGNITLSVGDLVHLVDSTITASVGGGIGNGGNITVDPRAMALRRSRIIANAFAGNGGTIRIIAGVFLADPESVISASSALGLSGTVDIRASFTDVAKGLALPSEFPSVTDLLRVRCAESFQGGRYSSLVLAGRAGAPHDPGALLLSPLPSYEALLGSARDAAGLERFRVRLDATLPEFNEVRGGRPCDG